MQKILPKNTIKPEFFKTPGLFRRWLIKNHDKKSEVWVGLFKKAYLDRGINYDQALDEALCFGWIDGKAQSYDEFSYLQRFTPRRSKSSWSKINIGHVKRLIKEGKMEKPGLAAVESAKKDGTWQEEKLE